MKRILLLTCVFLLAGCAGIRLQTDYEREQQWAGYSTFNFYPDMQTGLSELDSRRLLDAVETVLRQQGFRQSEEPDFLVNVYGETYQRPSGSSFGLGIGGTGRNVGGGVSVGIPVEGNSLSRQLTFDVIDRAKESLVWQAITTDRFREDADPLERERQLYRVAEKAFSRFPPQ
ncbi:DUF4136 domain-containing protein [Robiginitalea sp. SC105]|uniref:DUF4136 domain-containing protein n=1 Tax=Robiginitalea sp. SC105 TaxID=2762332 RepID=UPI00163A0CDA|nr:DUF4136 domain-containing protein [Robiginitalea sp. SC105]MBC2839597.1 DUF4136 domain-containing protein [Robiginitalea sp. SC105]